VITDRNRGEQQTGHHNYKLNARLILLPSFCCSQLNSANQDSVVLLLILSHLMDLCTGQTSERVAGTEAALWGMLEDGFRQLHSVVLHYLGWTAEQTGACLHNAALWLYVLTHSWAQHRHQGMHTTGIRKGHPAHRYDTMFDAIDSYMAVTYGIRCAKPVQSQVHCGNNDMYCLGARPPQQQGWAPVQQNNPP
jgi:hypothetical protein